MSYDFEILPDQLGLAFKLRREKKLENFFSYDCICGTIYRVDENHNPFRIPVCSEECKKRVENNLKKLKTESLKPVKTVGRLEIYNVEDELYVLKRADRKRFEWAEGSFVVWLDLDKLDITKGKLYPTVEQIKLLGKTAEEYRKMVENNGGKFDEGLFDLPKTV